MRDGIVCFCAVHVENCPRFAETGSTTSPGCCGSISTGEALHLLYLLHGQTCNHQILGKAMCFVSRFAGIMFSLTTTSGRPEPEDTLSSSHVERTNSRRTVNERLQTINK